MVSMQNLVSKKTNLQEQEMKYLCLVENEVKNPSQQSVRQHQHQKDANKSSLISR